MKYLKNKGTLYAIGSLSLLFSFGSHAQECMIDWDNKVPITIDNSAGDALTDYQVKLILDTETPIGFGFMDSEGDDIRFTSGECCDQLCYFIESGINTTETVIWVNVPEIDAAGTETINLFFGNSDATEVSDPECTFSFYEGFDELGSNFSHLCGTVTDSTIADGGMDLAWSGRGLLGSNPTFPVDETYTAEAMMNSVSGDWPAIYWAKSGSQKSYGMMASGGNARISVSGAGTDWCSGHNWASGLIPYSETAGLWSLTWVETGDIFGEFPTIGTISSTSVLYEKDEDLRLMIGGISSGTGSMDLDWIRVRKYAEFPPTFTIEMPVDFEPAPVFTMDDVAPECGEVELDAGPGYTGYEWSSGGTDQIEVADESGLFYITVTDDEGCRQLDSVEVTIAPSYSLTEEETICPGESYVFPDGTEFTDIEEMIVYTSNLTTDGFDCDSIIETTINVYEYSPVLELGEDVSTCEDTVFVDAGDGFAAYDWSDDSEMQIATILVSGTYSVTVIDDNECEQTDELEVTINAIDNGVTLAGYTLTSDELDGTTYQWLDCDDDYAEIDGATTMSHEAAFNGNYAVEVTKGECVDTSACVNVNGLSIGMNVLDDLFTIYPNPSNGIINLKIGDNYGAVVVRVTNATGQLIYQTENQSGTLNLEIEGADGLYFVEVIAEKGNKVVKVIKE